MKKPTIIINDLDAERLDTLMEQPAYAAHRLPKRSMMNWTVRIF